MSKPPPEMNSDLSPSHGKWIWNDDHQGLEFISSVAATDVKERKKKCKALTSRDTVGKRPKRAQLRKRSPAERNAVEEALVNTFKPSPKKDHRVAIEDIKYATLLLLQEEDCISLGFLPVLERRELDEFLASLLLYLSCFFEKITLEKKISSHMMEHSLREQQELAEVDIKMDLSLKQLAIHYSTMFLELTLSLLSAANGKTSPNDNEVFQCLYRFLCYAAWVAFERKDLSVIQEEVGRLLYADTFNPACKLKAKRRVLSSGRAQKIGETDPKDSAHPLMTKKLNLLKVSKQRTPLMEALLPPTALSAPLLSSGRKESSRIVCDKEALLDQLTQQLASLSFGILGKPLSQFSGSTLLPQGEHSRVREREVEHEVNTADASTSADKRSDQGRINTAVSRATTEGGYSDAE